jgi:hypothetical protein
MRVFVASVVVLLLAGCTSPGDAPAPPPVPVPEDQEGPRVVGEEAPQGQVVLYEHDQLVAGAGLATPFAPGIPVPWPLQPAKVERFTVPEKADLSFDGDLCYGTGAGDITVHAPNGTRVWSSEFQRIAGAPAFGCVGLGSAGMTAGSPFEPGEYEVRYNILGAMEARLTVTATLPRFP